MKPVVAISMGDYNGIGPEVILKSLSQVDKERSIPLILGHEDVFQFYMEKLKIALDIQLIRDTKEIQDSGKIYLKNCTQQTHIDPSPGSLSRDAGKASMQCIKIGTQLCLEHKASALVTAPISKEAIAKAGYMHPGHTEYLAELSGTNDYIMLMVFGNLRIGLITGHIPVSGITKLLTKENIIRNIRLIDRDLKDSFGIQNPKIAVLSLNPHAGDGGVLGSEELSIIKPALQKAKFNSLHVEGPFPADGFFGNKKYEAFDAVLAMYHDQGLIPFKTISFGRGVNYTAGLPIIRTSPDHGTAFDIAGMNIADHHSFNSAYKLSIELAHHKFIH